MLSGTFTPKLDDKGRFVIPAKFWEELRAGTVVTRGMDGSLELYSQSEFERLQSLMVAQLPTLGQAGRDYVRFWVGGASQEVPDAQRRIPIPPVLRQFAGIDKELTLVGAINKVEIWDSATWEAYSAPKQEDFARGNEEVMRAIFG